MATYLTLIKFTERGVKDIKDTCKRAADSPTVGGGALTQTESARESWPIFRPFRGMRLDSMASFPFKRVIEEA